MRPVRWFKLAVAVFAAPVLTLGTSACSSDVDGGAASTAAASAVRPAHFASASSKISVPALVPSSADSSAAGASSNDPPPGSSGGPSVSSDVVAQPKRRHGLWIWEVGKNGPTAARAAEEASKWGVGRVFIKSSEGAGGVRLPKQLDASPAASAAPSSPVAEAPRNRWAQNFSVENVKPFLDRGIEVWAFGYFYPDGFVDPDGVSWGSLDAQVKASLATLHDGVTGLVVDAESEFNDHAADATKLCRILRRKLGRKKLAFTSFGWLSAQRRFPFKAFDNGCGDAFLPQVYYDFGWPGGAHGSLERMRKDIRALDLKAPVWPVQSNERNASAADLTLFFKEAGEDASIFYLHTDDTDQTHRMSALGW